MSKKILIIEDQAPMRRNVALMLELEGYKTCTAENGRVGVEVARQEKPDLVLCDVMMPELDGYGVVQALREDDNFANTPFIFLTAKSDRSDVRIGMNFGADDYLTKPVVRDDLLAAVQTRLARAEALQERMAESGGFNPDFTSHEPLQKAFSLTPREAEVLLWVTQGKSNGDVAAILGMSEKTAKQHLGTCFQKMGVESRNAASLQALEVLSAR
ncbi:response regulator transcription factor [Brevifollis gellanilyticus]|uniref:DNA-binding response regulator n=1 Tax=Brevifollis gellanilyticus TaxID=748831 RepID=A0A512MBN7_9BACT|nr:response regulator transcription factor [Brevifollis gellanilyticus]GEP44134.1 DNA-binding response regulator [Brevifollis gellanilyticus]